MNLGEIDTKITSYTNTSTSEYTQAERVIDINAVGDELHIKILQAQDEWDFDDKNTTTTFPILTTTINSGQQDYSLPTESIKIKKVEITYDGTNWVKMNPIDNDEITTATDATTVNNRFSEDAPFYDIGYNSIFLYPAPQKKVVAGLKIWIDGNVTQFTEAELAAGTKSPGIDRQFHKLYPLKVAYEWLVTKPDAFGVADRLDKKIKELEADLVRHYGSKQKDRRYAMGASVVDYS